MGNIEIYSPCKKQGGSNIEKIKQPKNNNCSYGSIYKFFSISNLVEAAEIPKKYNKKSDNISINCDIKIDKKYRSGKIPTYKVKGLKKSNIEEAKNAVEKKFNIVNSEIDNEDNTMELYTDDGTTIRLYDELGFKLFNDDLTEKYRNMPFNQTYNDYSDITDDKNEKINKVKEILDLAYKDLKYTKFSLVKLDSDMLNTMNDKMPAEDAKGAPIEKRDHTGETVYIVGANQAIDNIPLEDGGLTDASMYWVNYMGNFTFYGEIDNDNIISIDHRRIYDLEKNGKAELKDFDDIYKVVENKFSDLLDIPEFTVTSCTFIERIIKKEDKFEAVPCWKFICKSENGEVPVLVNAVTGEEMPLQGSKVFN